MVVECLKRVESTGMGLGNLRVAREVMWGAMGKAVQGEWNEEAVEKAVKYAEMVWELMFDPKHREQMHGDQDAKKRPEILGVLVQMHAANALVKGEEGEKEAVEKYVKLMLEVWGNTETKFDDGNWNDANQTLVVWVPVWHGMRMARKVLGVQSPLGKELGSKTKDLESLIRRAQALLSEHMPQEGTRRGLELYKNLSKVSL